MIRSLNTVPRRLPVWAVWLGGLMPLALLVTDTVTGGLSVDPIRDIEHRLGRTALYFLVASLAVTPLLRDAGIQSDAISPRIWVALLMPPCMASHGCSWTWGFFGSKSDATSSSVRICCSRCSPFGFTVRPWRPPFPVRPFSFWLSQQAPHPFSVVFCCWGFFC